MVRVWAGKMAARGHNPRTEWSMAQGDVADKEADLCGHSDKLAMALVVLEAPADKSPIRIRKNVRMCGDCHETAKFGLRKRAGA